MRLKLLPITVVPQLAISTLVRIKYLQDKSKIIIVDHNNYSITCDGPAQLLKCFLIDFAMIPGVECDSKYPVYYWSCRQVNPDSVSFLEVPGVNFEQRLIKPTKIDLLFCLQLVINFCVKKINI